MGQLDPSLPGKGLLGRIRKYYIGKNNQKNKNGDGRKNQFQVTEAGVPHMPGKAVDPAAGHDEERDQADRHHQKKEDG